MIRLLVIAALHLTFTANANIIGTDAQNFNATTSGLDFVTVQSSETLDPGIFNIGFFLNLGINTLPIFEDSQGTRTKFKDQLLGADINVGYGLANDWDIGISFPQIWYQKLDDNSVYRGFYENTGNTEIRLNTKYRLTGASDHGIALVGSVNFNRIENNPYTGEGAGPTYNIEVAADKMFGGIAVGANLGYRIRSPGTPQAGVPIQPFQNQIIASAAISKYLKKYDAKLIGEIFATFPAQNTSKDDYRSHSATEALIGLKYDINRNLAMHFGGGTAIQTGTATPDWRVYSGLNYAFGPVFQAAQTEVAKKFQTNDKVVLDINFEFDSDRIKDQVSFDILRELANYLMVIGRHTLSIEGHTDSVGSDEYNMNLSVRRANAVRDHLIKTYPKLKAANLKAQGYGESMPIADNGNYQGRQKNRRVEFKINK